MTTTITFNYSELAAKVDRQLSIVGKRSTDENGKLIFTDITLGTNEKELINDYIRQAVLDIAAETAAFITDSETNITLTFPDNHNDQLDPFIQKSCDAYCVSFALWSWFTITAPRIADRYLEDCKRQLAAIIRLIHDKMAPATPEDDGTEISPLDISTEVIEGDIPEDDSEEENPEENQEDDNNT